MQLLDLPDVLLWRILSQLTPLKVACVAAVSCLFHEAVAEALRMRARELVYELPLGMGVPSLYLVAVQREANLSGFQRRTGRRANAFGFITRMDLERLTSVAAALLAPEAPTVGGVGVVRAGVQLNGLSLRHGDRAANVLGLETLARLISLHDAAQHLGLVVMLIILLVACSARPKDVYALRNVRPAVIRSSLASFPGLIDLRDSLPNAASPVGPTRGDFALHCVGITRYHASWSERIGSFAAINATRPFPVQAEEWAAMLVAGRVPIIQGDRFHRLTLPYFVGAGLVCEHGAASYQPAEVVEASYSAGSYRLYRMVGGAGGVEGFQDHIRALRAARLAGEWAIDIENVFYQLWVLSARF